MYVVYIDQLILENLLLNEVTLGILWMVGGRRESLWKIFFAGIMGTIMGVLNFLLIHNYILYLVIEMLGTIPFMTGLSMEMDKHARQRTFRFCKRCMLCFIIYILLGGCVQWLNNVVPESIPMLWLMAGACLLTFFLCLWIQHKRKEEKLFCQVTLQGKEHDPVHLRGLWDSGNLLTDPYFHRPVSITSADVQKKLGILPEDIRLLFVTTVAGNKNMLEAATISEMTINDQEKIMPVSIAFTTENIFEGKEYQIILPEVLRTNRKGKGVRKT